MSAYSSSHVGSAGPDGVVQGESVSVSFDLVAFSTASQKSQGSFITFPVLFFQKSLSFLPYHHYCWILEFKNVLSASPPLLGDLRELLRSQRLSPQAAQLQLSSLSQSRRRGRHRWGQQWVAHFPLPGFALMGPAGLGSRQTAVIQYLDWRGWLQSEGRALPETLVAVRLACHGG